MMRLLVFAVHGLRALIRGLITRRARVGAAEKFLRALALVPLLGVLIVLVRLWVVVAGRPLRVHTTAEDGSRYACDLPDLIQLYIFLFGVWEPDLAALIRTQLRNGDVFVDVGANIGFDALLASQRVGETGTVVAVEASPMIHQQLWDNLRRNGSPPSVRTVNKAAAARSGTLDIFAGPSQNIGLTTTVAREGMPHVAQIDSAPLSVLLRSDEIARTRLVKVDVEGGEPGVLAGLLECVDQMPRDVLIAVELSPRWWRERQRSPRQVLEPFLDRGFKVYEIANNYWPWRYLWLRDVSPPRRLRNLAVLDRRVKRLDIVLSRVDAEALTAEMTGSR